MKKIFKIIFQAWGVLLLLAVVIRVFSGGPESGASKEDTAQTQTSEFELVDQKHLIFNSKFDSLSDMNLIFIANNDRRIQLKNGYLISVDLKYPDSSYKQGALSSFSSPSLSCIGFEEFDPILTLGWSYDKNNKPMTRRLICQGLEQVTVRTVSRNSNTPIPFEIKKGELIYLERTTQSRVAPFYRRLNLAP